MSKNTIKQSKFLQNKKATAIALFLIFAMSVSLVALPDATAQTSGQKATYAFIGALPNPAGVGEEVLLHIGITTPLARAGLGWEGLSVTITKPDGTTETISGIRTDVTGGTGRIYVPTMAGNYTLQTHFPEQKAPATTPGYYAVNTTMLASDSDVLTLVVQEEPTPHYPGVPLPTEYWTRPIDAQAREWSSISGNWLSEAIYVDNVFDVPYNDDAPETPHILWAKQLVMGGLAGGSSGPHAFECGDAYEPLWGNGQLGLTGPVIIGGVLYYNQYKSGMFGGSFGGTNVEAEVVAVDLHTGEELWRRNWNNTVLAFGQTFYWDSFNYHAVFPYLWSVTGSTWDAYNPTTGRWEYSMTNVPPSDTNVYGPNGEIYRYTLDLNNGWMTLWNSSRVGSTQGSWGSAVLGRTLDAARGIEWNKTIPIGLPLGRFGTWYNLHDRIIGSSAGYSSTSPKVISWAISVKPGQEGQLLFNKTWSLPIANVTIGIPSVSFKDGVFFIAVKETRQYYGFSIDTGEQLWGPTEPQQYLDNYQMFYPPTPFSAGFTVVVDGKLISAGNSGIVYAYDVKTGERLWTYEAFDPYNEILWGNNWPMRTMFVTDGKIYLGHDEHSPIDPKPRGAPFICLNVTTGEEIWRADGLFRNTQWGAHAIIGDSIIATMDTYDERIYAIGKGPSATSVTIQDDVITHGDSVLVKGMVTDVSPGTKDSALTMRFPNGVPAVSDESMSDWMLYVYKQFPRPADVTGVEVVLEVLDPNNNFYEVGRTTSDADGMFHCAFIPEVPGEYTIIATFEGSEGYWPSHAETAINVEEAPAATPAPTPTPAPMTDTYVLGIGAAAIIAIVVIGLILILMLRKR